jgi:hypothetical protein
MMKQSKTFQYRAILLIATVSIIPLGLATKTYQGIGQEWVEQFLGDVLYQMLWIMLVCLVWVRVSAVKVAIAVFLAASAIEFLQLWQPPFLQIARSHVLGKLVLGTTFTWCDFPYYFLGSVLGWLWIRFLKKQLLEGKKLSAKH